MSPTGSRRLRRSCRDVSAVGDNDAEVACAVTGPKLGNVDGNGPAPAGSRPGDYRHGGGDRGADRCVGTGQPLPDRGQPTLRGVAYRVGVRLPGELGGTSRIAASIRSQAVPIVWASAPWDAGVGQHLPDRGRQRMFTDGDGPCRIAATSPTSRRRTCGHRTPLPPVNATQANGGTRGWERRHLPDRGQATPPRRDAGAQATTPVNATRANGGAWVGMATSRPRGRLAASTCRIAARLRRPVPTSRRRAVGHRTRLPPVNATRANGGTRAATAAPAGSRPDAASCPRRDARPVGTAATSARERDTGERRATGAGMAAPAGSRPGGYRSCRQTDCCLTALPQIFPLSAVDSSGVNPAIAYSSRSIKSWYGCASGASAERATRAISPRSLSTFVIGFTALRIASWTIEGNGGFAV